MPRINCFYTVLFGLLFYSKVALSASFEPFVQMHVLPSHSNFEKSTEFLKARAEVYCETYSANDFMLLKVGFKNGLSAWQSVQHLRVGPGVENSQWEKIYYWPDAEGEVLSQLTELMIGSDSRDGSDSTLDIAAEHPAIQGFSALEYLLYGGKTIGGKTCRLILLISHNISGMAKELSVSWKRNDENDVFWLSPEFEGRLLEGLVAQLDFLVIEKLSLESSAKEASLSNSSNEVLKANVLALQEAIKWLPENEDNKDLLFTLSEDLSKASTVLSEVAMPLEQAVTDEFQRQKILLLKKKLIGVKRELRALFEKGFSESSLTIDRADQVE